MSIAGPMEHLWPKARQTIKPDGKEILLLGKKPFLEPGTCKIRMFKDFLLKIHAVHGSWFAISK